MASTGTKTLFLRAFLTALLGLVMLVGGPVMRVQPAPAAQGDPSATPKMARLEIQHFDQMVTLPPGDPRRVSLPWLEVGTTIAIYLEATHSQTQKQHEAIQIEILRPQLQEPDAGQVRRRSRLESVFRTDWVLGRQATSRQSAKGAATDSGEQAKPEPDVLRYRVARDGRYLVALRADQAAPEPAQLRLRVTIDRPIISKTRAVTPKMLPDDTRWAVAIFSFGFLWTVLLLCGLPLIRAFRSEKRHEERFWFE